ncbi:Tripeptidyl-peptidase II protein [Dioscorea alata]|uniref:Tripeptidyl-peptidase II protein n=1 Tax=Dioscorea alata TaxID=55571 RepID=A0ACB7UHV0_DIOAL|nr:Tripeptidyl-peptidase II protein [Dioscorea alata]
MQSYVVYLGGHPTNSNEEIIVNSHHELLGSVMESKEKAKEAIFYSYTKAINGFAAMMEEDEAKEISKNPEVLSVFEDKANMLYTTHSWDFVGVWPESKSFADDGMGPIPSKWKGICQNQNITKFTCNKKLIGARYYDAGYLQNGGYINYTKLGPRDDMGHGTHTLSTSGGAMVPNVSFFGYANGTLRSGSPHARVAMYKVCWAGGACYDTDILAALDDAVNDGVDVLSLSLGADPRNYFDDPIAIGAFHAIQKGIMVICAAGNAGPISATATNLAPWIFTVAASTTDRQLSSNIQYNGTSINGMSYTQGLPGNKPYPIITSTDAFLNSSDTDLTDLCLPKTLNPAKVKGKIIVCNSHPEFTIGDQVNEVKRAGGVGVVIVNDIVVGEVLSGYPFNFTAINIGYNDGQNLYKYIASNKSAKANIICGLTTFGNKPAPQIADFSSRGPNIINADILKPDIMAPGVQILASFAEAISPFEDPSDSLRYPYTFMSGTSMATPHVAGLAGLLRSLNPTWSPAMTRSAIMTTATILDNKGGVITDMASMAPGTPFDYGAGQIQPSKAMDPGLVYDLTPQDYVNFLCKLGYNSTQMKLFIGQYKCPSTSIKLQDLNYPSITIPYISVQNVTINRTLTNVGKEGKYKVSFVAPKGTSMVVSPTELYFSKFGDAREYQVIIKAVSFKDNGYLFGMLTWSDGKHSVKTPLAVKMR